jgi:hypothetical protein
MALRVERELTSIAEAPQLDYLAGRGKQLKATLELSFRSARPSRDTAKGRGGQQARWFQLGESRKVRTRPFLLDDCAHPSADRRSASN